MKPWDGSCASKHRVVVLSTFVGIAACGNAEPTDGTTSFTRQALTFVAFAAADATIWTSPGNQGSAPNCQARNDSIPFSIRRSCLLRWDLTAIPRGSSVLAAAITIEVLDPSTQPFAMYELLKSWSETDANWTNREAGAAWQQPGAKGNSDRAKSAAWSLPNLGSRTIELGASHYLIRSWIDFPDYNYGISLASDGNSDAVSIASREHPNSSYHPRLKIEYMPPPAGGAGGAGGGGRGGIGGRPGGG